MTNIITKAQLNNVLATATPLKEGGYANVYVKDNYAIRVVRELGYKKAVETARLQNKVAESGYAAKVLSIKAVSDDPTIIVMITELVEEAVPAYDLKRFSSKKRDFRKMRDALLNSGVKHNEITLSNVLYSKKNKKFVLIDFDTANTNVDSDDKAMLDTVEKLIYKLF